MTPLLTRSQKPIVPFYTSSIYSLVTFSLLFSTTYKGLIIHPSSVSIQISLFSMSQTNEISEGIFFYLLWLHRVLMINSASECIPIHFPLTKILVLKRTSFGSIISNGSTSSWLIKKFSIYQLSFPTETVAIKDIFLTNPHDCPSGVSAGQITPQCVLCKCLGLDNFPVLLRGVVILLRCDNDDMYVIRDRAWATPCHKISPLGVWPQFPVAKACLKV